MTELERNDAIQRAKALLAGGFEADYVFQRLLKDGFGEKDASSLVSEFTGKRYTPPVVSSPAPETAPPPAVSNFSEAPAKPAEEASVQSLASLLSSPSPAPKAEVPAFSEATAPESNESASIPAESNPPVMIASKPVQSTPHPLDKQPVPVKKVDAAYRRQEAVKKAIALADSGYDSKYIQQRLVTEGFSAEEARSIMVRLENRPSAGYGKQKSYASYPQGRSSDASGQIIVGIIMVVLGCGISFFSFQAAANSPTGGTYVITFGLVIAGIFRILKGLSNS